ncbi:hypothetical protein C8R44DRAFT_730338 [Mycena epipterygia]|nr:hypothetical protein C8R44DRAFT_730338 [Mycena epipterygia]
MTAKLKKPHGRDLAMEFGLKVSYQQCIWSRYMSQKLGLIRDLRVTEQFSASLLLYVTVTGTTNVWRDLEHMDPQRSANHPSLRQEVHCKHAFDFRHIAGIEGQRGKGAERNGRKVAVLIACCVVDLIGAKSRNSSGIKSALGPSWTFLNPRIRRALQLQFRILHYTDRDSGDIWTVVQSDQMSRIEIIVSGEPTQVSHEGENSKLGYVDDIDKWAEVFGIQKHSREELVRKIPRINDQVKEFLWKLAHWVSERCYEKTSRR